MAWNILEHEVYKLAGIKSNLGKDVREGGRCLKNKKGKMRG